MTAAETLCLVESPTIPPMGISDDSRGNLRIICHYARQIHEALLIAKYDSSIAMLEYACVEVRRLGQALDETLWQEKGRPFEFLAGEEDE